MPPRDLILLNLVRSALEISLINSKLPLYTDIQEAQFEVNLINALNLNDTNNIFNLFDTTLVSIQYRYLVCIEYQTLSLF